jgi:hypothetical protein
MSEALRCPACGGILTYAVRSQAVACSFCGHTELEVVPPRDDVPAPEAYLPARVTTQAADAAFRGWASSSWWYPAKLREAQLQARLVYVPAWRVHARVESHWAGLVSAATRSGKRPRAGRATADLWHMIPASGALEQLELSRLQPFDEREAQPFAADEAETAAAVLGAPWEPPAMSERRARMLAHAAMEADHRRRIQEHERLVRVRSSALIDDHSVRLLLVPVYLAVFRFRERPWRCVINGQSGVVVGNAPIDRLKVAGVIAVVLVLVALALVLLR